MIVFYLPFVVVGVFLGATWIGTRILKSRFPGWPSLSFVYIITFLAMLLISDSGLDRNSGTDQVYEDRELFHILFVIVPLLVVAFVTAILALLTERPITYPLTSAGIFAISVTLYLLYRM